MMFKRSTVSADAQEVAAVELQGMLTDLIALGLQAKQLHWNVVGAHFKALHALFEEFAGAYGDMADEVAERMLMVNQVPDGRLSTVATKTEVKEVPAGLIKDADAVRELAERLADVIQRARRRQQAVGEVDAVTEDLLIETIQGLEKQLWMLQALEL